MAAYTITLLPSGHRFECPADALVLKAGLDAGLFMPYSCRSGVCNTCRGRIVEGEVDFGQTHPAYLSDADKARGFAMLCQARPRSDLRIELHELEATDAMRAKAMPARVLKAELAAPDVMLVTLGLPANEPTVFRAGQYLEVELAGGARRCYSIANPPAAEGVRQLELHIRHLAGGLFTDHVFGRLKAREIWKIELPMGTFFLRDDSSKPIVMIASGTGFAPIKSVVEDSLRRGLRRPITLYWGGRVRRDLYIAELAQRWADEHPHIRFVPVLSDATPACEWSGRTGFVHRAVMNDFADLAGHQVYACGAPVVVESAQRDFTTACRLAPEDFFADAFITAAEKAATAA